MTLYIKNMVCRRCEIAVETVLHSIGLHVLSVCLGEATVQEEILSDYQRKQLPEVLKQVGFELIDDKRSQLIEAVKTFIIRKIHYEEKHTGKNFSELLSEELQQDYSYLSRLFSEVEGITIEQYIIRQRIEKVKELLLYDELSLSQIADLIGYSSVAHLSAQFKKITGLSASAFKQITGTSQRRPLDKIVR